MHLLAAALAGALLIHPSDARAQVDVTPIAMPANSEAERYLRALQTTGEVPAYPWTLRAFSPREVARLRATNNTHPWADTPQLDRTTHDVVRGATWQLLPAQLDVWYNTARPFGGNDGAVWRGRGVTTAVQGGVAARWRGLSLVLAPVAFRAANASFELVPNGRTDALRFANAERPTTIDLPQRFGDDAYARVDPGQSSLRLDAFGLAAGVSTANQWWGPMSQFPYIMSNNAAGFPHVFAGSSTPWNVWVGHVHGRVVYGRLDQTAYTSVTGVASRRFAAALMGSFTPRGIPTLELGLARFYHAQWPVEGLSSYNFRRPFEAFLRSGVRVVQNPNVDSTIHRNLDSENQLASVYFRWIAPRSGFELYGEYGREDHNWDAGDLIQEPDHSATVGLGIARTWRGAGSRMMVLRAEVMDAQSSLLDRHRGQGGVYFHTEVRQGHTQRGQALGASGITGSGMGSVVSVDRYVPSGRLSVSWIRTVPHDQGGTTAAGTPRLNVQHSLGVERTVMRGDLEFSGGLTGIYDLNRNYQDDVFGVATSLRLRWLPR